jgi:hypothetical protein
MRKVFISQILVVDSYPAPHVIFTYFLSFMFLKYKQISSQLINSHAITMFFLNSILLVSILRTFELVNSSFKARVNSVSIHGHPLVPKLPFLLLPSLVKRFLWISGISGLVILPLLLSTKLFSPISCPMFPSKSSSVCSPCQQGKSHRFHFS